jgi:LCP family protein required for cell wall assembly
MDNNTQGYKERLADFQERLRKKYEEMADSDNFDFDDDDDELPQETAEPVKAAVEEETESQTETDEDNNIYDTDKVMLEDREDLLAQILGEAGQSRPEQKQEPHSELTSGLYSEDIPEAESYPEDLQQEPHHEKTYSKEPHRALKTAKTKRAAGSVNKWAAAFVITAALFVIVTVAYLIARSRYLYNSMDIHEIDKADIVVNDGVKDAVSDYYTIALYGVDSKDGNRNQGANSDTIVIMSINKETSEVKLVSVYKDTLMYLENGGAYTNKVTYAYQSGGALTGINTLNRNLDIYITDYVAVDFSDMADIVDALGGLDICVYDSEINSLNKNLAEQISLSGEYSDGVYEAGQQKLNGQQVVAYSRIKATAGGDVTRTKRQRDILIQIAELITAADDEARETLISRAMNMISTSLTEKEIIKLASKYKSFKLTDTAGFPFSYSVAQVGEKGNVLVPVDLSANVTALHQYLYGDTAYTPSKEVQEISAGISTESGITGNGAVSIKTDSSYTADDGQDTQTVGDDGTVTITTPPAGMIEEE